MTNNESVEEYFFAFWLLLISTISLLCILLNLHLIYSAHRWNGYVLVLFIMSLCQVVFDMSFYVLLLAYIYQDVTWLAKTYIFLNYLGGLSTSLWSNIISAIALYVVLTLKAFNIYKNLRVFALVAMLPPLVFAISRVGLDTKPFYGFILCLI